MYIIIARWMTHPLFLLFAIVINLFIGDYANVFIWIFIWLFLNLIFGSNSYLYKLWERKKSERLEGKIETEIRKNSEQHYKLWGGVGEKDERSNKQIYEEYLKEREKEKDI